MIRLTVIVPVYNGARTLKACLKALLANHCTDAEILVVDDRSTDGSANLAHELEVKVISNGRSKGPAGARNEGATHARGDILLFIDADITVRDSTLSDVLTTFEQEPDLIALFGSYDTNPACPNFLSQYKNLMHHFVHQISRENNSSFWAGCGAIRKNVFLALGGFNEKQYPNASIEDIELGLRLSKERHLIKLMKSLQVKHHKKWTPLNLLKADILYRAVPWTRLIAESGKLPDDLNLQMSQRWSALLACLLALNSLLLLLQPWWRPIPLFALAISWAAITFALIFLNRKLYVFFVQQKGILFSILAFFWHVSYYLYSSATFALLWTYHRTRMRFPHPGRQTRTAG